MQFSFLFDGMLINETQNDEFHISTERRLLYTCMTRARIGLYLIAGKDNPSRYIAEIDDDLLNNVTESSSDDDLEGINLPF